MAAFTYTKPTIGGSEDTWGTTLNANWDALGTFLGALDSTELAVLDGITATTAELNILDGVTATAAEFNLLDGVPLTTDLSYVDGVTSPIQTQIDNIPSPPTQTTATWEAGTDTTESLVSAAKIAAAIAAIPSAAIFGGGATYQNLTASRAASTSYQNTTGHYIFVAITAAVLREVQVSVDNSTWIRVGRFFDSSVDATQVSFPVPDLWYYRINGTVNNLYWAELRP